MWNKPRSILLSFILVRVLFLLAVASIFTLPWLVDVYINFSRKNTVISTPLLVTLYSCLVPAFGVLICLDRILLNIRKGLVFVAQNVQYLRILSWCCFAVSLICLLSGYYYVLFLLIGFAAAFFGLILRVLKNVFEQAVELKEESDFTV